MSLDVSDSTGKSLPFRNYVISPDSDECVANPGMHHIYFHANIFVVISTRSALSTGMTKLLKRKSHRAILSVSPRITGAPDIAAMLCGTFCFELQQVLYEIDLND